MNFASDNAAGVAPSILAAIAVANTGFAIGYGDDAISQRLERRMCELFERDVAVFLVTTGTAANALALAHLSPPWGAVLGHAEAHAMVHECGAPEFFGNGLRLVGLPGDSGKLAPATVAAALDQQFGLRPHQLMPAAVTITQASEYGTVYRHDEIAALSRLAHERGMTLHMDGARFANAVARLGAIAGGLKLAGRRRCAVVRGDQRRRDGGGGRGVLRSGARRRNGGAAQARRSPVIEAPLRRGAVRGLSHRQVWLTLAAPCQRHGGSLWPPA